MSVELIERPVIVEDGLHDKFTHIVNEKETPVVDGIVYGTPVIALCGKVWVPGDDPGKYELCPTCLEIAKKLEKEYGWRIPSR